jgi:hypothetical protein
MAVDRKAVAAWLDLHKVPTPTPAQAAQLARIFVTAAPATTGKAERED